MHEVLVGKWSHVWRETHQNLGDIRKSYSYKDDRVLQGSVESPYWGRSNWEREDELREDYSHLFASQPESRGQDSF
jgi:hypothetical protein